MGSLAVCPCILNTNLRLPDSVEVGGVSVEADVRDGDLEEPFGFGVRAFFMLGVVMSAV